LTLAVGVMIRRVIERCLGIEIGLKWPNDLVWDGRKLGGVLVELNAESQGHCLVVVGVGLNTAMPSDGFAGLSDWPLGAVDLGVAAGGPVIDRQELAAELIDEIGRLLARYLQTGFSPYIDEWRAGDYLEGRRVRLSDGQGRATGIAAGIAEDAALLIRMAGGELRRVVSGDVSVRLSR
jgi:BirA family biotin operon repressor/biotin-[acetyl-CoA-carboxylase] ligase